MSKPIFRQWLGNRFHYWGFIDNGFVAPSASSSPEGSHNPMNTDHEQFIERTDSHGVQLFAGDVVRWWERQEDCAKCNHYVGSAKFCGNCGALASESDKEYIGIVEMFEGKWCYAVADDDAYIGYVGYWPTGKGYGDERFYKCEKIGDIHTNPELKPKSKEE